MLDSLIKDHGAVLVDIEIPELFENGKAHNITIAGEMLSKIGVRIIIFESSFYIRLLAIVVSNMILILLSS